MDVAADDDDLKSETGELDYETSDDDDGEKLTSTAAEKSPRRIAVKSPIDKDGGEISSGREDDNANENDSNFKNADLEDGEIDELEEGEVKDDESFMDSTTKSPRKIPFLSNYAPKLSNYDSASTENGVCRFFLRGQCTWASFCKFSHPGSDNSTKYHPPPKADALPPLMTPASFVAAPQPPASTIIFPTAPQPPPPNFNLPPPQPAIFTSYGNETLSAVAAKPQPQMRFLPPPPVPPAVLTSSTSAAAAGETAWERGLKQARQMMKKTAGKEDDAAATAAAASVEEEKKPIIDSRRYYSRQGDEEKNPKNVYKRTSYDAKEWRDPWMRSSSNAVEQSPARKRRRSYSDSSRSSFSDMSSNDDDADQDEKSKRRRRQASSSSSSSAANNRVKSRSHDDNSSSASSVKARRRTARAETATNKRIKKKMDAGGNGRLAASDDENAQSPVELDEFDRTTTSIGFDIRNLVTKKELTNSPRKPIKLTINTKSRVQVPAAYGAPKPRRKRPVQLSPNPEDRLSSVSPCDLPSDDEEKLTAATAVGGRTVELEDISPQGSSDEDEEPDGRRSENSNQSEDRRRSYHSENDKEDISSEDTDESSSSSSDNEEAEKITDTLENETTNSLTDQKLAPPILAPSATSLSNVASINANAAEKSPSPPPSTAAPENQNDAAAVVVDEQNQDEIEKSANADAADKLIVPPLKLTVNSRREELLKQLRAVEEAIAKKRSMKMTTM